MAHLSDDQPAFIPYRPTRLPIEEMRQRAMDFHDQLQARRSVRHFSNEPVPRELIAWAIQTASSAPSGAHRQPWHFVAISDPSLKKRIREAAEEEERQSYEGGRMPESWKEALRPLGTDWHKPFLEIVPWIVVVFEELWSPGEAEGVRKNYYTKESVGIACGFFIAALHMMGLATLTHTPSPMGFLNKLLKRPANERPYILFPIGYPAADCNVPNLRRKSLEEVSTWFP